MHKFNINDVVILRIGERLLNTKILEKVCKDDKPFYKVDWECCGYNKILNTVSVCENSIINK